MRALRFLFMLSMLLAVAFSVGMAEETHPFSNKEQPDGSVWITGWTGSGDEVVIPSLIDGRPVSGIGDYVFMDRTTLVVTLPDNLTHIGTDAFGSLFSRVKRIYCSADSETAKHLTYYSFYDSRYPMVKLIWSDGALCLQGVDSSAVTVTVPEGVERVVMNAFYDNKTIECIHLPNSLSVIGEQAFYGCSNLTVYLSPDIKEIGEKAFGYFGTGKPDCIICDPASDTAQLLVNTRFCAEGYEQCELLWQDGALTLAGLKGTGPYRIPDGLDSISPEALAAMPLLTLPEDLTVIENDAFHSCGANRIVVPDTVTQIGSGAFADCPNLVEIRLPGNLTNLPDDLLADSPLVTVITSPGGSTASWCEQHGIPVNNTP